ncbi:VWA domain-containing protein BatB [Leptospira ilyithenensis]|uniref:VWA domain-containing protein n=1 Tax=Leptospira ilyithenensis TaxID=2484901 RepID=A0A4R9LWP2_9LEPT|nr:VWA domain-containing protein [Leptospira ilyithenensis]TGN14562.1 VWA domain-containing protein [Leptospira ilyithenensis]
MTETDFNDSIFKWISLLSISITLMYGIGKIFFLFKIGKFQNIHPSLKERFVLPSKLFYALGIGSLILGLTFAIISLFHTKANEMELSNSQKSVDILFLVDVSLSMNAVDVNPTRLKRFQDIIIRILPDLTGNRFGMIVFAGSAFSYCPMTTDTTAFADYVNALGVEMVGKKGTNFGLATKKAEEVLSSSKLLRNKIVVLVSDGEDNEESSPGKLDAELVVWGLGTKQGGPIYYSDSQTSSHGYVTVSGALNPDQNGSDVVISNLNEENLKSFASLNSGEYYNLSQDSSGAYQLVDKIDSMKKNQTHILQKIRKEDGANIFLYLSLGFFFLERIIRLIYIRRTIVVLLLILFSNAFQTYDLYAWGFDPGGSVISEGVNDYRTEKYKESKEKFQKAEEFIADDPRLKFNKAASDYKMGNFQESIEQNNEIIKDPKSSPELKSRAHYNNGNAYAKKNDYQNAQKSYEKALSIDPDLLSAKKNLEHLRKKKNGGSSNPQEKTEEDQKKSESGEENSKAVGNNSAKNKKDLSKEHADRMMDSFSPDSILKKKADRFPNVDNEKFW